MYHRVGTSTVDPWGLCVSPTRFADQVGRLAEFVDLVPLCDLHDALCHGRKGRPTVAITFDDGYVDNLTEAAPILRAARAPATVFVATEYIGSAQPFWWDVLADAILGSGALPESLTLGVAGRHFEWHDPLVNDGRFAGPTRQTLHQRLWDWISVLPPAERDEVVQRLQSMVRGGRSAAVGLPRPMTPEEVRSLVAGGPIEIGAHTATHCRLPTLTAQEKWREISGSREACKKVTGDVPRCFAYPNGAFDDESVRIVADSGFSVAVTSEPDFVWRASERLKTPRIMVRDWTGEALVRRLRTSWMA